MGLLDDAIREHLDLQRRRGADPTEVERAEREALGPVRRGVEPAEGAGDEAEAPPEYPAEGASDYAAGEPAYAPADEAAWSEPASEAPAPLEPVEPSPLAFDSAETSISPAPDTPPEAAATPAAEAPLAAATPPAADTRAAAAPPPPVVPPPAPADSAPEPVAAPRPLGGPDEPGGETVEYDVEHALEHEPQKESEDVLEETPEFLQDTPDHDRLWFEQRPPRDFDFDG